jgi:hypothetical protein
MAHKFTKFAEQQLSPEALRRRYGVDEDVTVEELAEHLDDSDVKDLQRHREALLKFLDASEDDVKITEVTLALDGKPVNAWSVFKRWRSENGMKEKYQWEQLFIS